MQGYLFFSVELKTQMPISSKQLLHKLLIDIVMYLFFIELYKL